MKRISILMLILFTCVVSVQWVQAQAHSKYIIVKFDPPGPPGQPYHGTQAPGINAAGAITGFYADALNVYHGFLRNPDGTFAEFDAPGAGNQSVAGFFPTPLGVLGGQGTYGAAINKGGSITGTYIDIANVLHGFVRTPDGTITEFDVPGAGIGMGLGTEAANISANGTIAGDYFDANNVAHGFVMTPGGKFTTFDVPGAGTYAGQGTWTGWASCITPAGAVTGWYVDVNNVYHGYMRDQHGVITTIDAPGAGTAQGQGTFAWSLNTAGSVTAAYFDKNGVEHGYVLNPDGTFSEFDVPRWGAGKATIPEGIDVTGKIVGNYLDANGANHGFLRLRNGAIQKFNVTGAGLGAGQGTVPLTNIQGMATGSYIDANSVIHGFLVTF